MKSILILWAVLCSGIYAAELKKADCMDSATTQTAMNQCAASNLEVANDELNTVYQGIRRKYKQDAVFLAKMKIAQLAWIKFRDVQIDMYYPHRDEDEYYGSALPMCIQLEVTNMTLERIKTLNKWLPGSEEGDVCSGSIEANS